MAGDADRSDVTQMYMQPFVTHNWKSGSGLTVNMEMTQNWEASTTNAYINIMGGALTKFGNQLVQFQVGPRLQLAAPEGSKSPFGLRAAANGYLCKHNATLSGAEGGLAVSVVLC